MPEFRLYNTLSRRIEPFAPSDGATVSMYTCGPTVYNPAHLGNFRTFLFEDLLRRTLLLRGWGVRQVMNLTDVDDKIIRRATERAQKIDEVTEPVIELFHRDREYLRIQRAEEYPRATAYIPQMIALVEQLVAKGVAYVAEDRSVYFAIRRFPSYGRLSRLDTRELKEGARVAQDDYAKENAQDFALWKSAKEEDERAAAAWDSPWGRGRPGWHLECSAMAIALLGETLDLHCGGIDLVFPHHEDEIAQSEAATGQTFARLWCHGEFLLTEGAKMAKRVGNVATVEDLRDQGISGAAVRHFVFSTHYRKQLNLSSDALEGSSEAVRRIRQFHRRLSEARRASAALGEAADEALARARAALFDDLSAPEALAALFDLVRKGNAALDRAEGAGEDPGPLARARDVLAELDSVFDLVADDDQGRSRKVGVGGEAVPIAEWVAGRLEARRAARAVRDFALADRIRAELEAEGVIVEDLGGGTRWTLRP